MLASALALIMVTYLGFCLANCTTSCCINCLTPLELPSLLQNLMVSRASCGTNLPRPFFRGALLLIQPDLRNIHLLLILRLALPTVTVLWEYSEI